MVCSNSSRVLIGEGVSDGGQYLVVYNLSRFSRSAGDHATVKTLLSRPGVSLLSVTEQVTEDPVGKFTSNIIIAVAQFDNDAKSERAKVGMRAAAERGRWPFQAPLGYNTWTRGGRSLEVDVDRAPAVRMAFDMCATGRNSKLQIVRSLAAFGMRTRAGRPISAQTLSSILQNEIYVGPRYIPTWNLRTTGDFNLWCRRDLPARSTGAERPKTRDGLHPEQPGFPSWPIRVL